MSTYSAEPGEQRYTQAEQSSVLTRTTSAVGNTTSGQPTITCATGNFTSDDVGRSITGAGIPASTYIKSVQSTTAATLTNNATATSSTVALTISETTENASGGQGAVQVTKTINPVTGLVKNYRWWPLSGHAGEARLRF